jgi:hypothetical protein
MVRRTKLKCAIDLLEFTKKNKVFSGTDYETTGSDALASLKNALGKINP